MSYGIPRHACSCEHGHDMDYPPCPRCAAAGQPPLADSELSELEAVVAGGSLLTRLLAGFLDAKDLLAEQRAALEALRSELEVRVTLHMGTAEEIGEAIDACERLADGGEFRKTLITEILRVRAHSDALAEELERWRHGEQVEGDYVCPDSLALIEARAEIKALRERIDLVEKRTAVPPPRELAASALADAPVEAAEFAATIIREARESGRSGQSHPSFAWAWQQELAALTEEQRAATIAAHKEGATERIAGAVPTVGPDTEAR